MLDSVDVSILFRHSANILQTLGLASEVQIWKWLESSLVLLLGGAVVVCG